MGCFYALRQKARSLARARGMHLEDVLVEVEPGSECSEALRTVAEIYADWDGLCPIIGGFSPTAFPQYIGFTDASTTDGCGGLAYPTSNFSLTPDHEVLGFSEAYPPSIRQEFSIGCRKGEYCLF